MQTFSDGPLPSLFPPTGEREEESEEVTEPETCSIFITYKRDLQVHQALGAWGGVLVVQGASPQNSHEGLKKLILAVVNEVASNSITTMKGECVINKFTNLSPSLYTKIIGKLVDIIIPAPTPHSLGKLGAGQR